ncbi:hypothetical protein [Sphingomonas sp.]|uniref:hypothetical protein n=1 Tax=Sphingomonas sp. TaxID=28214 RepID=UPI003BA9B04B
MATLSKRAATQRFFEEKYAVDSPEALSLYRDEMKDSQLTLSEVEELEECISIDIASSYERCAFTLYQAVSDLQAGDRLWASVKLYYSTFYALRAEILLANRVVVRAGRFLIVEGKRGAKFSQYNGNAKGDHGVAIALSQRFCSAHDILQSQTINGAHSYEWLKSVRETVQYKLRRPPELHSFDPFFPDSQWSIYDQINTFLSDNDPYFCFDPDYAALALPLKRFQLTGQALRSRSISCGTDFYRLMNGFYKEGSSCSLLKPFI